MGLCSSAEKKNPAMAEIPRALTSIGEGECSLLGFIETGGQAHSITSHNGQIVKNPYGHYYLDLPVEGQNWHIILNIDNPTLIQPTDPTFSSLHNTTLRSTLSGSIIFPPTTTPSLYSPILSPSYQYTILPFTPVVTITHNLRLVLSCSLRMKKCEKSTSMSENEGREVERYIMNASLSWRVKINERNENNNKIIEKNDQVVIFVLHNDNTKKYEEEEKKKEMDYGKIKNIEPTIIAA